MAWLSGSQTNLPVHKWMGQPAVASMILTCNKLLINDSFFIPAVQHLQGLLGFRADIREKRDIIFAQLHLFHNKSRSISGYAAESKRSEDRAK